MKIAFHGAARNVTGSKHLITLDNGFKILLDCGLFQGMGHDTETMNRHFGFDPAQVDVLILSHAHIDHSGLIPRLVNLGFKGKIYATPATVDLAQILLADSAKIQLADLKYINRKLEKRRLPQETVLYTDEDVRRAFSLFVPLKYKQDLKIHRDVTLQFTDAGHIIGSAAINLQIIENEQITRLTFSGDVGRYGDLILRAPQPFPQADVILLESTYGAQLHEENSTGEAIIERVIRHTCVDKQGKLIIPAFSVGRTQEILYLLNKLELAGRLPKINVFVDSPLSAKATQIVENHADGYNSDVLDLMKVDEHPFDFERLVFIDSAEESKALNHYPEPCIIISASGMAEAGRVKHHIWNSIEQEKNSILFVGYCEPHSLGGKLIAGAEMVSVFGERMFVKAEIFSIRSMSAHGDQHDLLKFLASQDARQVKQLFLVHGEYENQLIFKEKLMEAGFVNVEIPIRHQAFDL